MPARRFVPEGAPAVTEWDRLADRSDEELADELIAASLPELAARRDLLLEVLRARFEEVAGRAFRQAGGSPASAREFGDWFWTFRRLLHCVAAYRRTGIASGLEPWLYNQARWRARDFFREQARRRRKTAPLPESGPEDPAAARGLREVEEAEHRGVTLTRVRACIEALRTTVRLPYKLVHLYALDLSDQERAALGKRHAGGPAGVERALGALRGEGRRLELAEVAALTGRKLHTVGTYVARAAKAVIECVRRRERRGARA
jgi:DNA-directed RNA polymerase specialized sigma24 family protein